MYSDLYAVRVYGGGNVLAVGSNGVALKWSGFSWQQLSPGTSRTLLSIWDSTGGASTPDMWIGGTYGTLLRWNGTTFSSVTLPSSASNADITSVWGTSTSDLWLGTGSGYNAVYHFDGNTWSELRLGARYTPNLIIGTASTDLWGFGPFDGQIIRYHP
jgi:hypothetical protein